MVMHHRHSFKFKSIVGARYYFLGTDFIYSSKTLCFLLAWGLITRSLYCWIDFWVRQIALKSYLDHHFRCTGFLSVVPWLRLKINLHKLSFFFMMISLSWNSIIVSWFVTSKAFIFSDTTLIWPSGDPAFVILTVVLFI